MKTSQAWELKVDSASEAPDAPAPVCPACQGFLAEGGDRRRICIDCEREFPIVAELVDLRLHGDRYLELDAERAKAERLHEIEPGTDAMGLASAYYAMTQDVVDHRRARFLQHIAGAESRGLALATQLPESGKILEIGCGTGGLLVAAAGSNRLIVGVDIASRWLVVARRRLSDRGLAVPLFVAEAERLPWPDASFDAAVADSVLEHIDDPAVALREWKRVVRPGGRLVVWSPNRFTLTTDPHLGLWGVGWLPRHRLPLYLRIRGRSDWPPRTLSAAESRRLAIDSGWKNVVVSVPPVPREWALTRPFLERLPLRVYEASRRLSLMREVLRHVGPLWELRAEAPG